MNSKPTWTRRAVLGVTGAAFLAGCLSDDGPDPSPEDGSTTGADRSNGGQGGERQGSSDVSIGANGAIGQVLMGETVSFMVEYVEPVEEVLDFREFPRTDDDAGYGVPRTVDHFTEAGFVQPGASLYAVGIAVEITTDAFVDASTFVLASDDEPVAREVFMGRTQRRTYGAPSRSNSRLLAPGEVARGESVFALLRDPEEYTLTFQPATHPTGAIDRLSVDLGAGSDAEAGFESTVDARSMGEASLVGDLEVTVHAAEYVPSVRDSPYQDIFGPRDGFEYLLVDLSATRRSDEMIGQDWAMGVRDVDGYGTSWRTVYQDVNDLNRTRLEELAVGESISNTELAFPIEDGFRPAYLTMNADGPVQSDSLSGRQTFRAFWRID